VFHWSRALGTLALIHDASRMAPPRLRDQVAANLAGDAMRDIYGGIPGTTWGRPGTTLDEELEQYAMTDLAFVQLIGMEAAALRQAQSRQAGG
jgi:hypothetical protein